MRMRLLDRVILAILISLFVVVLGIYTYAWVFRMRVERLLTSVQAFQVEETPALAILELRRRYHSEAVDHGSCSEEHCEFSIGLTEWESLMRPLQHERLERLRNFVMNALRPFGLRLSYLEADFLIERGKLRKLDVRLHHGYVENDRGPIFIARAVTAGNLGNWQDRRAVYEHPNLLISEPSSCTGCSGAIVAEFTWQASHGEFERALGFNFSCITRFHPCRAVEEFLPSAAQLLKADRAKLLADISWRVPCDARTAQILGRDSDFVNIATIRHIKPQEGGYVTADYDVLTSLKGKSIAMTNIYHPKQFTDATTDSESPQSLLQVGAERIVFLSKILDKPSAWSECAVMPDTPENLAAALKGISADRSVSIGRE